MKKVIVTTSGFDRELKKLEKKFLYSEKKFLQDIEEFFQDESNTSFRKHKISNNKADVVYSISLDYDLRTLYFTIIKSKDLTHYVFFSIGDHDHVY